MYLCRQFNTSIYTRSRSPVYRQRSRTTKFQAAEDDDDEPVNDLRNMIRGRASSPCWSRLQTCSNLMFTMSYMGVMRRYVSGMLLIIDENYLERTFFTLVRFFNTGRLFIISTIVKFRKNIFINESDDFYTFVFILLIS